MDEQPPRPELDERQERIVRNEAIFRELNEQIRMVDEAFAVPTEDPLPLICECGDNVCTARVEMTRAAYEALRADPARFVVLPGHVAPDVEDVVEQGPGYLIVEKRAGDPRALVEELSPRS